MPPKDDYELPISVGNVGTPHVSFETDLQTPRFSMLIYFAMGLWNIMEYPYSVAHNL